MKCLFQILSAFSDVSLEDEMKITRTLDRDGTLGPLALNYLAGIPEQYVFFREQQLRHPASTYSLSLDKLSKAFVSVVEYHARDTGRLRVEPSGGFEINSLLSAQEHLLHSTSHSIPFKRST